MTRSIFDPSGGPSDQGGSTYGSATGESKSNMPQSLKDGKVDADENPEEPQSEDTNHDNEVALNSDEAAERLSSITPDAHNSESVESVSADEAAEALESMQAEPDSTETIDTERADSGE